jgi:hypothetical protein
VIVGEHEEEGIVAEEGASETALIGGSPPLEGDAAGLAWIGEYDGEIEFARDDSR